MKTVTVHKAKTNLSRLLRDVCKGEEILIARGKTPIARIIPANGPRGERKPGWLKGKVKIGPEFFEPLPPEELDLWWQ